MEQNFAWRHYYWRLTNEGIQYLRDYLHLPAEVRNLFLRIFLSPLFTFSLIAEKRRLMKELRHLLEERDTSTEKVTLKNCTNAKNLKSSQQGD